ncbi:transcriptional regulator [Mycobacterium xenopi RIVM700367]|uniref:TetR/AcrR family transcriptional regulator n=1 Tax=Mycobacterium xenopi TaxID=1789 RepID=UPI00025AEA83|nr:TetR family transcriptional regulator [Mycobacterium xenopi]EID09535.1 transcriptional regulator [Mycobacterium xenopi RIVM700367]
MPVQERPRRKYAPRLSREARRAQLLDTALDVLAGCELHELAMETVAAAAGIAKPVLYTVFRTRAELVGELLHREHQRGIAQISATLPTDLTTLGPAEAYIASITAFLQAVLANPTRWRLILTVPDSAPRAYRDSLRRTRSAILAQAEDLARAGTALMPQLADVDPHLLAHTLLSFAEMLGRLAVRHPETYPRERLEKFAASLMGLLGRTTAEVHSAR